MTMNFSERLEAWRKLAANTPERPELWNACVETGIFREEDVPQYAMPNPLVCFDGTPVTTPHEWIVKRRPELLEWFTQNYFGPIPPHADHTTYDVLEESDNALDGTAFRRQVRLNFAMADGRKHSAEMLMYLPKYSKGPLPAFVGLNFKGNHTTTSEEAVRVNPLTAEVPRGDAQQVERWQHKLVVSRGYASVTACYHDFFPDRADGWGESIWALFEDCAGRTTRHPTHGSISAWAWGLQRMLDCLETMPEVDATRVVVHGHSRLGKTALWAGSSDQRFQMVVSNDSGSGGAALARRYWGETLLLTLGYNPHWYPETLWRWVPNELAMPVDMHELIALCAPRPVVVASASEDRMADPHGEFLSAFHAGPVYKLLGHNKVLPPEMPAPDICLSGDVSYHLRTGPHDQKRFDWEHYLSLADQLM